MKAFIADKRDMKVYTITVLLATVLLALIAVPVPLFAQQGNTGTETSTGSSGSGVGAFDSIGFEDSGSGVENASAQVTSEGGFVGASAPTAFVGIDEVYNNTVSSNRANSSMSTRRTSTTRSSTRTTASRRTSAMRSGATRSTMSNSNAQFVRATASIDFEVPRHPSLEYRGTAGTAELHLKRIQGIQDSRISVKNTPQGTTIVLMGTVASERERRVAQQLLLLEPGISQVENLLEIR